MVTRLKPLSLTKINIAIDGFSSCGKSTIAKGLAKKLGYIYIDTGAMYRAVTLALLRKGFITNGKIDEEGAIAYLNQINISFQYNAEKGISETMLNGANVEAEIRGMEVSKAVSSVSAIQEVRAKLVQIQKELGKQRGVVMDGRDIGTEVFPDAELKIFVTADPEIRAKRRYDELVGKGHEVSMEEVRQNLEERDHLDQTRTVSPLRQANDAVVLDNTGLSLKDQLEIAYNWAQSCINS